MGSNKLYVGNLPYSFTSRDLEDLFSGVGKVTRSRIISDRETGRSKGFGFVEMDDERLASEAITSLNGKEISGRKLTVSIAKAPERPTSRGRENSVVDYR